jgi:hypothetical protein
MQLLADPPTLIILRVYQLPRGVAGVMIRSAVALSYFLL